MQFLLAILIGAIASMSYCFAQDAPKSVKTMRVQQPSLEVTTLYSIAPDGVVKIDWDAVETLASSKADKTLSPVAEMMIAIRDRSWKPMR